MKTKLLYHENSFTYECSARVVGIEGDDIALDATVFYPGGGGQMPDRGIITWDNHQQEGSVIALNKRDDEVWHTLDRLPPPLGTEVICTIDWDFRYRMMRTHTALHILCGIIWKEFGVQVTGGQMYPDKARMDFAMENLNKERIAYIEDRVNEAIQADYPIRVYTLPRDKAFADAAPRIDDYLSGEAQEFFGRVTSGLDGAGVAWGRASAPVRAGRHSRRSSRWYKATSPRWKAAVRRRPPRPRWCHSIRR